jgi:hypothetical protein
MIRRILFFLIATIFSFSLFAQKEKNPEYSVPLNRQLFHDNIDKNQKKLLKIDPHSDAVANQVDRLQYELEIDDNIETRIKVGYLIGLADVLDYMYAGWQRKEVNVAHFAQTISLYKKLIEANNAGKSMLPYVQQFSYDIVYAMTLPRVFEENAGYRSAKDLLLIKYLQIYPDKIFQELGKNLNSPYADSLIKAAAKQYPSRLYSYAQANDPLGNKIRSIKDDALVRTIVRLSQRKSGQMYFPFLDNLVSGKITLEELENAANDSVLYFRYLVRTQLDYVRRAAHGDTAIGFQDLTNRLQKKAQDDFVTVINGLHEEKNPAVRFAVLQSLTSEELFYLAVLSDGLIYTSSYTTPVYGVFAQMLAKCGNRGDSLLMRIYFDHYRKFISQAAGYNTLKDFLQTFGSKEDAATLMTTFVSGLEKSARLEDGVDVADAYSSIFETLPDLAKQMLSNVQKNYDRNLRNKNEKGIAIYNILLKLFLSADPANNIDLTKELGIPPVYSVSYKSLANDKGEIICQMFFYGDDDGKTDFDIFLRMFTNNNWTIDQSSPYWVVAKSVKGAPVFIYANRPLPNEEDQDYVAQTALENYFQEKNMAPTVVFHRGHSYHAPTSIGYMSPSSKIVFMGACGGYILIDSILKKSADAHIITSKQIGKRDINRPFITLLTEKLRAKQDIEWLPFWKEFRESAKITGMEDYVPPYKNLGALFIKAYKLAMKEDD